MFTIALKMIFCLLLAALLGFILGYLFAMMRKCDNANEMLEINEEEAKIQNLISSDTEEEISSRQPAAFQNPLGQADDLKMISGIGPKIEEALHSLGIFHFSQIAEWTEENVNWINNYLVFKGRVQRENWVGQAESLSKGMDTAFSKKYKEK